MKLRALVTSLSSAEIAVLKRLLLARENALLSADADEYAVNNYACPHCGHRKFFKNGRVRGSQRFKCHKCSKTFGLKTNTMFHATRKPLDLWSQYIDLLFEQKSIRQIVRELEIAPPTAFFWKHKILAGRNYRSR